MAEDDFRKSKLYNFELPPRGFNPLKEWSKTRHQEAPKPKEMVQETRPEKEVCTTSDHSFHSAPSSSSEERAAKKLKQCESQKASPEFMNFFQRLKEVVDGAIAQGEKGVNLEKEHYVTLLRGLMEENHEKKISPPSSPTQYSAEDRFEELSQICSYSSTKATDIPPFAVRKKNFTVWTKELISKLQQLFPTFLTKEGQKLLEELNLMRIDPNITRKFWMQKLANHFGASWGSWVFKNGLH